jgi:glutamate 5-kinase
MTRRTEHAEPVPLVMANDSHVDNHANASAGRLGTGGMATKLEAARKAAAVGIATIIADGRRETALGRVLDASSSSGTLVLPAADRLTSRKHWIAFTLRPRARCIGRRRSGGASRPRRSLLPSGVRLVEGSFGAGDCVRCVAPDDSEVARGR